MHWKTLAFAACCLVGSPVLAEDPASEASIRALIEVSRSEKMVETVLAQMQASMDASLRQAAPGQMNPRQQEVAADMRERLFALVRKELAWASLEPTLIDVYAAAFTQEEVDGMIAFYRSQVGQSMLDKMPMVMQRSMVAVQAKMQALLPQVQALAAEGAKKMRAAAAEPAPAADAGG